MISNTRKSKSVIVAVLIGLLFPLAWIVFTGEGRISEVHSKAVMTPTEYEEFMEKHSRPMTVIERIKSAAFIVTDQWKGYLGVSVCITMIVYILNYFVWPSDGKEP